MERNRKITIQDVAKRANVSAGTIDRVIHNRGKVSAEKKKKVEKAIRDLNFNPNLLARTLALGKSFRIGVLLPGAPSPRHYWSMPFMGIETAAAQFKDYGLAINSFHYDLFDEDSFARQASVLLDSNPDAAIVAPLFLQESRLLADRLDACGIPCVFIDADLPGAQSLSYIGPELSSSAFIAGRLLNSVLPGCCDILIVNMVKGYENASALQRIEAGFKNFFSQKEEIQQKTIHTLTITSTRKEDVFQELEAFHKTHPDIKGCFVTNSKAYLVAEYYADHGLNIKIAGYDLTEQNIAVLKNGDIEFIISQSPFQQGERAVKTLFDYFIFGREPDRIQHVPLDIIIRENVDFYLNFNRQHPLKGRNGY